MYCSSSNLTLYKSRDNAITVVPYSEYALRTNFDMAAVVRVVVNADAVTSTTTGDSFVGDSDVDDTIVWWAEVENAEGVDEWRIFAKVGMFTGIVAGEYTVRITIFDNTHINGLVIPSTDTDLIVTIVDLP